jgi:hypothetical protein
MQTPSPSPELHCCTLPDISATINDHEIDSGFIPTLRPANARHDLVLFCIAFELYKRFPNVKRCHGCKYNILSQSHHINCNTAKSRSLLLKGNFEVDAHSIWQHIWKLKQDLPCIDIPTEQDVELIAFKCKEQWRNLVITAILYDLENFPQEWQDCLMLQDG